MTDAAPVTPASATDSEPAPSGLTAGNWTSIRLVALAEHGPCLIDLSINVGGSNLEQASQQPLLQLAQQLLEELPTPASWSSLLELPLVQSGWLGNLTADSQQQAQLVQMYDSNSDGLVSSDELPAFLSRGLSRAEPLSVRDVGYASDFDPQRSPWGPADRNGDFVLDESEQAEFATALAAWDLNGDGVVHRSELRSASASPEPAMTGRRRNSWVPVTTLLFSPMWTMTTSPETELAASGPAVAPESDAAKTLRQLAGEVLRHYTILSELESRQWPNWDAQQVQQVDLDGNQKLDAGELRQWLSGPPAAHVLLTVPAAGYDAAGDDAATSWHAVLAGEAGQWADSGTRGLLTIAGCSLQLELQDGFSQSAKQQLAGQLQAALGNEQRRAALAQQLGVTPEGFALLDRDQDAQVSEAELDRVWQWLTARAAARLSGRWALATHPWFQLADANADDRLAGWEIPPLLNGFAAWDGDGDRQLAPNELPLVASLVLSRSDPRLAALAGVLPREDVSPVDDNWFRAMDTNRDGTLGADEFLGEMADFSRLDINQDGFLSSEEVSLTAAGN